jgi:hypothetical protein
MNLGTNVPKYGMETYAIARHQEIQTCTSCWHRNGHTLDCGLTEELQSAVPVNAERDEKGMIHDTDTTLEMIGELTDCRIFGTHSRGTRPRWALGNARERRDQEAPGPK